MDKDAVINALVAFKRNRARRSKEADDILANYLSSGDDTLGKYISSLLARDEKDFLEAKKLHLVLSDEESDASARDVYGVLDSFDASLTKKGNSYEFILPPMYSAKRDSRAGSSGKHIKYIVLNLIKNAEFDIEVIKDPVVIFEHHVETDSKNELVYMADADNLDSKACIDAMQKFLFDDDNIFSITSIHRGIVDTRSYTKVCVMGEREYAKKIVEAALSNN